MTGLLISSHFFGDFILQNDWMQAKSENSFICTVHVLTYSIPFLALIFMAGLPFWAFGLIIIQHWLQDRFSLHLWWLKHYKQTPPEKWPIGPLFVDQALHISFLGLIGLLLV